MTQFNERITEQIVRDMLRDFGYYDENNSISVEEQKSGNPLITKCLRRASKSGGRGFGRPEFLIGSIENSRFIIVIECKADVKKHESEERNKFAEYAVDGVLLYAAHLATEYNVIAIAVSGQNRNELKISTFIHAKGANVAQVLIDSRNNKSVTRIYPYDKIITIAKYDGEVAASQYRDLMEYSRELHVYIRDYAKLSEAQKPLLVSGILIALRAGYFRAGYRDAKAADLPQLLFDAIKLQIDNAEMPKTKKAHVVQPYTFITAHSPLAKVLPKQKQSPLQKIVMDMDRLVFPFISIYNSFDVIGQFYAEFLRYAGGDASLGIVLTPQHIADLFANLAILNPKSVVLDTCVGTAGFLIASMMDMCKKAKSEDEIEHIKRNCLIGVENQPKMFALAVSNMILRGDGKANLYQGSCFDKNLINRVRVHKPTVGMINPPYAQKGEGLHELNFIDQMLDCLVEGGVGLAIVPMSCAIQPHPMREVLMRKHTLEAVMSMPDELFYPVGTISCIMVWKARIPHDINPHHKTWFGYWKDDGFTKVKYQGRVDLSDRWQTTKQRWLTSFFNKSEIVGECVVQRVTAQDEWCAEAYMETDYSDIEQKDFVTELKKYLMYVTLSEEIDE